MDKKSIKEITLAEQQQIAQDILNGDQRYVHVLNNKKYVGMRLVTYIVPLHYTTVRQYVLSGVFPSIKIGRRFLVEYEVVLKMIASGELANIPAVPYERKTAE
jgi:hypothetical protein